MSHFVFAKRCGPPQVPAGAEHLRDARYWDDLRARLRAAADEKHKAAKLTVHELPQVAHHTHIRGVPGLHVSEMRAVDPRALRPLKEHVDPGLVESLARKFADDPSVSELIVTEDNLILDGHHRAAAALRAGALQVPVVYVSV